MVPVSGDLISSFGSLSCLQAIAPGPSLPVDDSLIWRGLYVATPPDPSGSGEPGNGPYPLEGGDSIIGGSPVPSDTVSRISELY